jgi:hypothetical protein
MHALAPHLFRNIVAAEVKDTADVGLGLRVWGLGLGLGLGFRAAHLFRNIVATEVKMLEMLVDLQRASQGSCPHGAKGFVYHRHGFDACVACVVFVISVCLNA